MDPDSLFAYGSLMFPEVLRVLLDRVPEQIAASASGWRIIGLSGRVYPALIPGDGVVSGYLLTGLTREEWRLIDAFEDPVYDLRSVALTDGRRGWAYVCGDTSELPPIEWEIDQFRSQHLAAYMERCAAWRQKYESRE